MFMTMRKFWQLLVSGFVILSLAACVSATKSGQDGVRADELVTEAINLDLSGIWEYQEGEIVYELSLDRNGNGNYEWQGGRFETTFLSGGLWKGKWMQARNNREGGFDARLANDGLSAHGRWWYTRIEEDRDPLEPGGQFTLRRKGKTSEGNILGSVGP